jgi:LysM repeat protein
MVGIKTDGQNLNFLKRNKKLFMKKKCIFFIVSTTLCFCSCSPIKSSPEEETHRNELTLHELQTNVDDSRHDLNCFRTELEIIDSKIKHIDNIITSLKQTYLEKTQARCDLLSKQVMEFEKKVLYTVNEQEKMKVDLYKLSSNSNEMTEALGQFKRKINEVEHDVSLKTRKMQEVIELGKTLVSDIQRDNTSFVLYKVKAGDSLGKIAQRYGVKIDSIKKMNSLQRNLIVVGQELKIPKKS